MHLLTAVTLLAVAATAALLPVMRGLRLDPSEALRAE
jgi:ABC-type lipoprotein release transport system permease subunit